MAMACEVRAWRRRVCGVSVTNQRGTVMNRGLVFLELGGWVRVR
jgi:hypothetical protein